MLSQSLPCCVLKVFHWSYPHCSLLQSFALSLAKIEPWSEGCDVSNLGLSIPHFWVFAHSLVRVSYLAPTARRGFWCRVKDALVYGCCNKTLEIVLILNTLSIKQTMYASSPAAYVLLSQRFLGPFNSVSCWFFLIDKTSKVLSFKT